MIPGNLNRCRFEILENNKQTRESTALSVAYNVERWRRGWEGIVGRRRRVATGGDRGTSSARRNVDVSVHLCVRATGKAHHTQVREWMGGYSDQSL
jgi:hypothetical protein